MMSNSRAHCVRLVRPDAASADAASSCNALAHLRSLGAGSLHHAKLPRVPTWGVITSLESRLATLPFFGPLAKAASVWQCCRSAVQERMPRQSGKVRVLDGAGGVIVG
jgi:hypothetical protein